MGNFNDFLNDQMEDEAFANSYKATQTMWRLRAALKSSEWSWRGISDRTGVDNSKISLFVDASFDSELSLREGLALMHFVGMIREV